MRARILRLALFLAGTGLAVNLTARELWHYRIDRLIDALDAQQPVMSHTTDDGSLPTPVARYLAAAVAADRAAVGAADVETEGEFLMTPPNGWKPFHARQHFGVTPPGFVWDARIAMAPFMTVFVRDAYVGGRGEMVARVLGLYAVVDAPNSAALAEGQLMRFLAEMIWIPSALRPGRGITWTSIDDQHAAAHLSDRGQTVTLQFTFNANADIVEVFSPARMRAIDGGYQPAPWAVRCWDHQNRLGFRIPTACEAEWRLPEGPRPYWRGRVTNIRFDAR